MNVKFLILWSMLCIAGKTYPNVMKQNPFANKFFTGAFNGPPENALTQKHVNEIAGAGIDVIITGGSKEYLSTFFDYAEKADVKVIPMSSRWIAALEKQNKKQLETVVKEIVKDYSGRTALLAYGIYDEPAADLFPSLAFYTKMFSSADHNHPPLINLLPSYGSPIQLGAPNFQAYINKFIKEVQPAVLSYDYYPFREGATLFDGWHNNLKIVRQESRNANIPFWIFVQSEGIKGGLKVPTREEIFWQANTALAYGARGILWFCYWTPPYFPKSKMAEKHYSAMIDIKGKKTKIYDYVKEENTFLQSAGKNIADWDNKYIAGYQSGKLVGKGKSPVGVPKGKNFKIVIGTFTKDNKLRLVFANNSFTKKTTFVFTPEKTFEFVKNISLFHTKIIQKKKMLNVEIEPGGCAIVEFATLNLIKQQKE